MPRPIKQLAVLLLIRGFHALLACARVIKRVSLAVGRMLLMLTIIIGGPIYRWTRWLKQRAMSVWVRCTATPTAALGVVVTLMLILGVADNFTHRTVALDPFSDRLLFQLLPTRDTTDEGVLEGVPEATSDEPTPITTMINGETTVLKPQILVPLANRKTPTLYHVAAGDTVSSIAEHFGLALTTILWENKLTERSTIRIGQELSILPVDGVRHTVKSGDTIASIAKRYDAPAEKILEFNGLKIDTPLRLAVNLIIPGGKAIPAYAPPPQPRTRLARIENFITQTVTRPAQRLGNLLWPTSVRRLTQYFSWRHGGIDVKGAIGNPVYAAAGGTVIAAGWNRSGYGNQVLLEHADGRQTRYAHLSKVNVKAGNVVTQGELIGLIGSTGRSTGPHLHFEVMANGRRLNPLGLLR